MGVSVPSLHRESTDSLISNTVTPIVMYRHPTGLKGMGTHVSRVVFEVPSLHLAFAPSDDEG